MRESGLRFCRPKKSLRQDIAGLWRGSHSQTTMIRLEMSILKMKSHVTGGFAKPY